MTELKYIETGIFNEKDEEGVEYPGPYAFPGTIGCFFWGQHDKGDGELE